MGGETCALGAERVLDHLHQQLLALVQQAGNGFRLAGVAVGQFLALDHGHVGGMQERRAIHADIDEGGFHPGQHPADAPLVDVADDAALARAFDPQLLEHPVLHHGTAHFLWRHVDQNFSAHRWPIRSVSAAGCYFNQACNTSMPKAASNSAVS